jgi:phosphate-selective porin O/P
MNKTMTTIALVTMSGSALAQSGLDIDRAYAAELRADADTRSSLLTSSASALDVEVFTQFRYTYDSRDELMNGTVLGDADTTVGFSAPRTQIRLDGAVEGTDITGHVSFDFGGAFDHSASSQTPGGLTGDGGATLRTAYGAWALDDNWTFIFGQIKNPYSYEANVAPEHSQGVERSLTNSFFDVGYTQGIAFNYSDDEWKFTVFLSDGPSVNVVGFNPANSYYTSASEADISLTGRLDWLVSGTWDQFDDFASWQGSNDALRIGAGVSWAQMGDTNPTPGVLGAPIGAIDSITSTVWSIDAQYESDGWGLFASYTSMNVDIEGVTSGGFDMTMNGLVLQGNFFFTQQFEGFARYDMIMLDDDPGAPFPLAATDDDQYSMITVGFNYYLVPESHAARFSMDVGFGLDDTTGLDTMLFTDVSTTGFAGGGASAGTESNLMIRAQMSLLF